MLVPLFMHLITVWNPQHKFEFKYWILKFRKKFKSEKRKIEKNLGQLFPLPAHPVFPSLLLGSPLGPPPPHSLHWAHSRTGWLVGPPVSSIFELSPCRPDSPTNAANAADLWLFVAMAPDASQLGRVWVGIPWPLGINPWPRPPLSPHLFDHHQLRGRHNRTRLWELSSTNFT
jgi:hypothetical protein